MLNKSESAYLSFCMLTWMFVLPKMLINIHCLLTLVAINDIIDTWKSEGINLLMKDQCLFEKLVVILKPESKEDNLTNAAAECMFINQSKGMAFHLDQRIVVLI